MSKLGPLIMGFFVGFNPLMVKVDGISFLKAVFGC